MPTQAVSEPFNNRCRAREPGCNVYQLAKKMAFFYRPSDSTQTPPRFHPAVTRTVPTESSQHQYRSSQAHRHFKMLGFAILRNQNANVYTNAHGLNALYKHYKELTRQEFDDDDDSECCDCEEACDCWKYYMRFKVSQVGRKIESVRRSIYGAQRMLESAAWCTDYCQNEADKAEEPILAAFGTNDVDLCVRSCIASGLRSKRIRDSADRAARVGRQGRKTSGGRRIDWTLRGRRANAGIAVDDVRCD